MYVHIPHDTGLVVHRGNSDCTTREVHQHCSGSIVNCVISPPQDLELQQQDCKVQIAYLQDTSAASKGDIIITCQYSICLYVRIFKNHNTNGDWAMVFLR